MIPKILHQTWKSKIYIPENFRFWSDSFSDCNPGLERRLYDDIDNRELLVKTVPQLLPLYQEFPREIFRVDFIRCLYLFYIGGVYADFDFQCLTEFTDIFSGDSNLFLGSMGTDYSFPHSIPNALMASNPNQGVWLGYLANIEQAWLSIHGSIEVQSPEWITGPVILRNTALQYQQDIVRFKNNIFQFITRHSLE